MVIYAIKTNSTTVLQLNITDFIIGRIKKRFVNDEMVVMFLYLYIKLFIFISQYEYHFFFYVFPNKLLIREVSVRVLAPNPSVVDPLSKPECLEPLLLVVSIPEEAEDSEL